MAGDSERRPFEIKTTLSEAHYNAMLDVCEAMGLTQAGYVRMLILRNVIESQSLVEQMTALAERPRTGRNES